MSANVPRCVIERGHDRYPASLLDMESPPEAIYVFGDPDSLCSEAISIVGARRCTPYGCAVAEIAGRVSAESGITVVSGGAMGCDSMAARAALDAGGRTVVVSGCGADVVYPRTSRDVFERAVESGGAVVSLERWGSPPRKYAFPKRNLVIAALSPVTLICEAGEKSGTMSTALAASDLGRTLYAVPGSIFSAESQGTNRLIADGASPICSEHDLEACIALDYNRLRLAEERPCESETRIMSALVATPMRADDLARYVAEDVLTVLGTLADYEANGFVVRLRDGRYSASKDYLAMRDSIEHEAN